MWHDLVLANRHNYSYICVYIYILWWSRLLVHGTAEGFVLVGGHHLVHVDPHGGQEVSQVREGLVHQGGLPAQDPGKLGVEEAVVAAPKHQRVASVVCGQHPVGAGERGCTGVGVHHKKCLCEKGLLTHSMVHF